DRSLIVFRFRRALNKMYTVAEPRVLFAAISASRSEIPSRPGFAFKADSEDTLPFATSAVVDTTSMLRDTTAALDPVTRAPNPAAQTTASTAAIPAAIFTATRSPSASSFESQPRHQGSHSARPTPSATVRTPRPGELRG